MLRGGDIILRATEEACCCTVGGLSKDGMFGVDTVECQGACVNAPVLVVDDDYYVRYKYIYLSSSAPTHTRPLLYMVLS